MLGPAKTWIVWVTQPFYTFQAFLPFITMQGELKAVEEVCCILPPLYYFQVAISTTWIVLNQNPISVSIDTLQFSSKMTNDSAWSKHQLEKSNIVSVLYNSWTFSYRHVSIYAMVVHITLVMLLSTMCQDNCIEITASQL